MGTWQPPRRGTNDITLDSDELRELKIVKQAILKSAIEGGVVVKKDKETDEEFLERWIHWVFRNEARDKKLTETDNAF